MSAQQPIELIGGELDGEVTYWADLSGAPPPPILVMPAQLQPPQFVIDTTGVTESTLRTVQYERGTISDVTHHWRYLAAQS